MANTQNVVKDVMHLEMQDQKKWLEQRGWIPSARDSVVMWRHPETGIRYVFPMAMKMALQDCRLPADYQLNVVVPAHKLDETVTDAVEVNTPPTPPQPV